MRTDFRELPEKSFEDGEWFLLMTPEFQGASRKGARSWGGVGDGIRKRGDVSWDLNVRREGWHGNPGLLG